MPGRGRLIGLDALSGATIAKGDFVIFHTGHIATHPYGSPAYFGDHPQLDWALIHTLVNQQVSFIGVDGPALRQGREEHAKVDMYCEEHGTYVVENLSGLDSLAATEYRRFPMHLGWISHPGMTGIPMRVVAETTP